MNYNLKYKKYKTKYINYLKLKGGADAELNLYEEAELNPNRYDDGLLIQMLIFDLKSNNSIDFTDNIIIDNINEYMEDNKTLLMIAVDYDNIISCRSLLDIANINIDIISGFNGYTALMIAAEKGNTEICTLLIESRANIEVKTPEGYTALMIAIEKDKIKICTLLIERGANIYHTAKNDKTVLMCAVESGNILCCLLIINKIKEDIETKKINTLNIYLYINKKKNNGMTALMIAAKKSYVDICNLLMDNYANVTVESEDGYTALMIAAYSGNLDICKSLISKMKPSTISTDTINTYINKRADDNMSALMMAVKNRKLEVCKFLIEKKAYTELTAQGKTTLMYAAESGNYEIFNFLLQNIKRPDEEICKLSQKQMTPLMYAAKNGHLVVCRLLIDINSTIGDIQQVSGKTALMYAAKNGYLDVCHLLINHVNIELYDKDRFTTLMYAVKSNNVLLCRLFIEKLIERGKKEEINKRTLKGNTALTIAATQGNLEICKLFIEIDANLDFALYFASSSGNIILCNLLIDKLIEKENINEEINKKWLQVHSALTIAINKKYVDICKLLICHNAVIDDTIDGKTILMYAVEQGNIEICISIIDKLRRDENLEVINRETPNGTTALMIAADQGYKEICELLLANGANINKENSEGNMALQMAAIKGNLDLFTFLIHNGAYETSVLNIHNLFISAVEGGDVEICRLVIGKFPSEIAKIILETEILPLAMKDNNINMCRLMIENGVKPESIDPKNSPPLLVGAKEGYEKCCIYLIKQGANIKALDSDNFNCLIIAARKGLYKLCNLIIERQQIDINIKINGFSALLCAAKNRYTEICRLLITNGANILVKTDENITVLMFGAMNGSLQLCKLISSYFVDEKRKIEYVNQKSKDGMTALMYAAISGNILLCKFLLNISMLTIDQQENISNQSALMFAATNGHYKVCELLIKCGANVQLLNNENQSILMLVVLSNNNQLNETKRKQLCKLFIGKKVNTILQCNKGYTALIYAANNSYSNLNLCKILCDNCIDYQGNDGHSALTRAVTHENIDLLDFLIGEKANLRTKYLEDNNILIYAINEKKIQSFKLLLNYINNTIVEDGEMSKDEALGHVKDAEMLKDEALRHICKNGNIDFLKLLITDVNYIFSDKKTLLSIAVIESNVEICSFLIENGADVNLQNSDGVTALMYAASKNLLEMCTFLIENDADVNLQNNNGVTALMYAASKNLLEMCTFLIGKGAVVNWQDSKGNTALMHAASKNLLEMCTFLIQKGTDVNLQDSKGKTALIIAFVSNNIDICNLLILQDTIKINIADNDGLTLLMYAAKKRDFKYCNMLLDHGSVCNLTDKNKRTALMHSFLDKKDPMGKNKHIVNKYKSDEKTEEQKMLESLDKLSQPDVINLQDIDGNTAIMIAIENGLYYDCKILYTKFCDINLQNNKGMTALMISIEQDFLNVCSLFCIPIKQQFTTIDVSKISTVDETLQDNEGRTALMHAIMNPSDAYFKLLSKAATVINITNNKGRTALMYAAGAIMDDPDWIKRRDQNRLKLLGSGAPPISSEENITMALQDADKNEKVIMNLQHADKNKCDEGGITALMWATILGMHNILQYLIDKDSINHCEYSQGDSAFIIAIKNSNEKCYEFLFESGADLNIQNKEKYTALMFAVIKDDKKSIRFLLQRKVDINIQNNNGETALFIAVSLQNIDLLTMLLKYGANVNIIDNQGCNVLHIAINKFITDIKENYERNLNICHKLLKKGAVIDKQTIDIVLEPNNLQKCAVLFTLEDIEKVQIPDYEKQAQLEELKKKLTI